MSYSYAIPLRGLGATAPDPQVLETQRVLQAKGFLRGKVDGVFGNLTRQAQIAMARAAVVDLKTLGLGVQLAKGKKFFDFLATGEDIGGDPGGALVSAADNMSRLLDGVAVSGDMVRLAAVQRALKNLTTAGYKYIFDAHVDMARTIYDFVAIVIVGSAVDAVKLAAEAAKAAGDKAKILLSVPALVIGASLVGLFLVYKIKK